MLSGILAEEAFGFILLLTRFAALIFIMPAFGDTSIPRNVRTYMALGIALAIFPAVREFLPALPGNVISLFFVIAMEFLIGVIIATTTRILMSTMNVAGTIIAFQTGLSAAQSFDPSQGTQGVLVASFLTLMAVTMVFATDTHHLMIMGMVHSYVMFPVGEAIPIADFAGIVTYFVSATFRLGVQISAPFILYSFVFNLALGLISKLIPQFQVFFVSMPVNIFLGFGLLMFVLTSMMMLFMEKFKEHLLQFLG